MLRRDATTIKLSPEDILAYDEYVEQRKHQQEQQEQQRGFGKHLDTTNNSQSQSTTNVTFQNQFRNTGNFSSSNILQEQMGHSYSNEGGNEIVPEYNNSTVSECQTRSKNERIGVVPR
ncbi:hypothetical protein KGF56_004105 [Candida oxycetoniae]|uniref:Uncharacterized protein n=1 Tax=Candida oxycetoniae TaxID=497107 RepID=A0AAI9SUC1_9ASCO|nr:uncharacterized protein KGF56_004105 [Candida oxycetoniae]KAI3403045.2 hypothetical protein KGF56_004105 [Candida oxycetoniae]